MVVCVLHRHQQNELLFDVIQHRKRITTLHWCYNGWHRRQHEANMVYKDWYRNHLKNTWIYNVMHRTQRQGIWFHSVSHMNTKHWFYNVWHRSQRENIVSVYSMLMHGWQTSLTSCVLKCLPWRVTCDSHWARIVQQLLVYTKHAKHVCAHRIEGPQPRLFT